MSSVVDRREGWNWVVPALPRAAAIGMTATAMWAAAVDYRETLWELSIWPRTLQGCVLVLAASAIVLALVPRGSLFTRLFAFALVAVGVTRSVHSLGFQLPAILWPGTVLMLVLVGSGTTILVLHSKHAVEAE